jgi:hypothetical protein
MTLLGERGGDFQADVDDFRIGQRQLGETLQQRFSRDSFHDDIGLYAEIAHGDKFWNVAAGQARQDHLLHLETDERRRVCAFRDEGDFHQHGHGRARARNAPKRGHSALMNALLDPKAVDRRTRFERRFDHASSPQSRTGRFASSMS